MAAPDPAMTLRSDHDAGPTAADGLSFVDTGTALAIVLDGRLDALRALPLRSELDELVVRAVRDVRGVLVDLSDVVFVDSAALAALVRLRRQCGDAGLDLALVKPRDVGALRIFSLTQFDQVFVILDRRPW